MRNDSVNGDESTRWVGFIDTGQRRYEDTIRNVYHSSVKTTRYFDLRMQHPTRQDITKEMCERVVAHPDAVIEQGNGEWQLWGFINEIGRYLRVIITSDREALVNAFWDRNFKEGGR